jgi:predicted TIM-barrel fold metal-dependent hydrolase
MPREVARAFGGKRIPADGGRPHLSADALKRFLSSVEGTSAYRYVLHMLAGLFDFHGKEINENSKEFLSEQIRGRTGAPGWARDVLHSKSNIEALLCDCGSMSPQRPAWANEATLPVLRTDHFLFAATAQGRRVIERRYNVALTGLDSLLSLIEVTVRTAAELGFVGLRSSLAAFRTLHIQNVDPHSVQGIFEKGGRDVTSEEGKRFQDFIFHILVRCAMANGLPMQIDAGLDGASSRTFDRANPLHLTDMIFNYADARFAVLHGGFPFTGETSVLAKTFPNLYLDGAWFQHTATTTAKAVLHEWLEVVPCSKIMIWGGNSRCPEASYVSLLMAKDLVAEVLAEKVQSGYFSESVAVDIAWKLFRENAKAFYHIDRARQRLPRG